MTGVNFGHILFKLINLKDNGTLNMVFIFSLFFVFLLSRM